MPYQTIYSPSRVRSIRAHDILSALLFTALAGVSAACGPSKDDGAEQGNDEGTTGGVEKDGFIPGYPIDCLPADPNEPVMCIPKADWNCPLRGHYFREAICADVLGGTPSEYDGKPEIVEVDPDGAGPEKPTADIYCDDLPEGVIVGLLDSLPCNDCNVCSLQLNGRDDWLVLQGYGWDEFSWCPDTYEAIAEQICDVGGSAPTTGGDDDTGAGGPGIWKCIGSWTISGTMNETDFPQSSTLISMSPPNVPDCVNAADVVDAASVCLSLCDDKNEIYQEQADASPSKNWIPFNCDHLGDFTPEVATDPSECSGGGPMALTDTAPFVASATLTIGGAVATSDQLGGLLQFSVGACPADRNTCDVALTDIRTDARDVHGMYTNATNAPVLFNISDLEVRMLQPVSGEWSRSTGVVTFPGKELFATISTGAITLGGEPLSPGLDDALFVVEGAQGVWDGSRLTLDLPWRRDGLALSLHITTR